VSSWLIIARIASISTYKKGGKKMKYSIEQIEMLEAMAEAWTENHKVELSESQTEQLMRESDMPRLTNDQRQMGSSLFK
jgi:hypothetical protein